MPILRAGLGMLDGVLDAIPNAKVSVVGIARNHVDADARAVRRPARRRAAERTAIVLDPMLATGGSMISAVVAAQVARRDRHPRAGARRRAGRHRRARRGASRRALLDRGDRQPPQRERLHHPRPRRRRGPDLRHALGAGCARAVRVPDRIGTAGRSAPLMSPDPRLRRGSPPLLRYAERPTVPIRPPPKCSSSRPVGHGRRAGDAAK